MTQKIVDAMASFADKVREVYTMAEGLRDCTESGKEKAVFNQTRGGLYDVVDSARALADDWKERYRLEQLAKRGVDPVTGYNKRNQHPDFD